MARPLKNVNTPFNSSGEVFRWMESFTNLEARIHNFSNRTYRLDRMAYLLKLWDNPHQSCPVFHVAGSKGKGSTSALIAGALTAAGHKTGLYTSPHISSYLERITVSGEQVAEELLLRLGESLRKGVEAINLTTVSDYTLPTTFELLTLLAFLVFRETGCAYAVLEVGLGGRLDATNVVTPLATLITPIEREHTEILGDTLEKIAAEKAGIIKKGVPLFCAGQKAEAEEVLRQTAMAKEAPYYSLPENCRIRDLQTGPEGTFFQLTTKDRPEHPFKLALLGRYQAENAALAYLALTTCLPELESAAISAGFAGTRLPGRMEHFPGSPPFVLDGAHTPLSMRMTVEIFTRLFGKNNILIFGSVQGKDHHTLATLLAPHFKQIIISTPGTFKQSDLKAITESFRSLSPGVILEPDNCTAFKLARSLAAEAGCAVLITGSFYLVAEFRNFLV